MRSFLSRMLLVLAVAAASSTSADIFYSFDPAGSSGQNFSVNIDVNTSSSLSIYLVFTGTDATTLTSEKGLFSADIEMRRIGTVPSQPVGIASAASVHGNTLFDDPAGPLITYANSGDADLLQTINPLDAVGVPGTPIAASMLSIKLGDFTFTAGGVAGEATTFQAQDTPVFNDTITFTNNLILDSLIGSAKVTFITSAGTNGGGPGGGGASVPLPVALYGGTSLLALLLIRSSRYSL